MNGQGKDAEEKTWLFFFNACVAAQMVTSSIQSSAAEASRPQTDKRLWTHASYDQTARSIQSNLFNTDTKGKDPSVRFTEVSVL